MWIIRFLSIIAGQKAIEDNKSLFFLLKYARKNLVSCLVGEFNVIEKYFILCCCINFNLARLIYIMLLKIRILK